MEVGAVFSTLFAIIVLHFLKTFEKINKMLDRRTTLCYNVSEHDNAIWR